MIIVEVKIVNCKGEVSTHLLEIEPDNDPYMIDELFERLTAKVKEITR